MGREYDMKNVLTFCSKRLFEREHNTLYIIPVHYIIHPYVAETQHHQILHHFFTEIVINPEQICFVEMLAKLW